MWIKIICIEYILWGIPTIESTFDIANMVKTATVKDAPINNDALLYTGLLNLCLGKWYVLPYLVVPLMSATPRPMKYQKKETISRLDHQ